MRVGFKARLDGVGMELGSESNVVAIGAGGDGRRERVVVRSYGRRGVDLGEKLEGL